MLGFDQFVDQRRGGCEVDPAFPPAGRHRQPGQQVGLAVPLSPIRDGLGPLDVPALGESPESAATRDSP